MAIAVTDKGSWKLAGLEFSTKLDDDNFKWADNYPTLAQPCPAYNFQAPDRFGTPLAMDEIFIKI